MYGHRPSGSSGLPGLSPRHRARTNTVPKSLRSSPDAIEDPPKDSPNEAIENLDSSYEPCLPFGEGLDSNAAVWTEYLIEADDHDKEMVEKSGRNLDALLVFSGLFSAVLTAFIVESLKMLEPAVDESVAGLLAMLLQREGTSAGVALSDRSFVPPVSGVWVNAVWFAALASTLGVSLASLLLKQLLDNYRYSVRGCSPKDQALRRHYRFTMLKRWRVPVLINTLPSLLHLALGLFFGGLVLLLWNIHAAVAGITLAVGSVFAGLYLVTTLWPLFDPGCPFHSPGALQLKLLFRNLGKPSLHLLQRVRSRLFEHHANNDVLRDMEYRGPALPSRSYTSEDFEQSAIDKASTSLAASCIAWLAFSSRNPSAIDTALGSLPYLPYKPGTVEFEELPAQEVGEQVERRLSAAPDQTVAMYVTTLYMLRCAADQQPTRPLFEDAALSRWSWIRLKASKSRDPEQTVLGLCVYAYCKYLQGLLLERQPLKLLVASLVSLPKSCVLSGTTRWLVADTLTFLLGVEGSGTVEEFLSLRQILLPYILSLCTSYAMADKRLFQTLTLLLGSLALVDETERQSFIANYKAGSRTFHTAPNTPRLAAMAIRTLLPVLIEKVLSGCSPALIDNVLCFLCELITRDLRTGPPAVSVHELASIARLFDDLNDPRLVDCVVSMAETTEGVLRTADDVAAWMDLLLALCNYLRTSEPVQQPRILRLLGLRWNTSVGGDLQVEDYIARMRIVVLEVLVLPKFLIHGGDRVAKESVRALARTLMDDPSVGGSWSRLVSWNCVDRVCSILSSNGSRGVLALWQEFVQRRRFTTIGMTPRDDSARQFLFGIVNRGVDGPL